VIVDLTGVGHVGSFLAGFVLGVLFCFGLVIVAAGGDR
jgi:hypothetical protein